MKWWIPIVMILGYGLVVGLFLGTFGLGIYLLQSTFDDPHWSIYIADALYITGMLFIMSRKNLSKDIEEAWKQIWNNY